MHRPALLADGSGAHPPPRARGRGTARERGGGARPKPGERRRELSPPRAAFAVIYRRRKQSCGAGCGPVRPACRPSEGSTPIGPCVLDFYSARARLAVEIDGMSHELGDWPERDPRRDAWHEAQGVKVVRIAASEVLA